MQYYKNLIPFLQKSKYNNSLELRYCLFGLNVGLTEKFESNSKPMKIHVSDPCKMLLDERYVLEERSEGQELMDKVNCTSF